MSLACEDGNSKLFGVVTVADVDAEKPFDNSLIEIWKLKFGQDFGADVWLRFWSWCLVEILKMKFDQDLCLNLWYELNSRVRCTLGNVSIFLYIFLEYVCSRSRFIPPADCYCLHTTARPLQPTERRGATLSANKMGIIIILTLTNGEFSDGDPF